MEVSKLAYVEKSNLNFVAKKLSIYMKKKDINNENLSEIVRLIHNTEDGITVKANANKVIGETCFDNNGNIISSENAVSEQVNGEKSSARSESRKSAISADVVKILIGTLVYIFGIYEEVMGNTGMFGTAVFLVAYVLIGGEVLLQAAKNIFKGRVLDENFLMAIATIGAVAIGEYAEAVGVMLFYQIGEYLQGRAVGQSRRSISTLMEIKADFANVKRNGQIMAVAPETVNVGEIIAVKPGERVPLDGIVEEGTSMVDTSAITGESVLRNVSAGDVINSGTINTNGLLYIKTTAEYEDSTVAKILDMVENAGSRKSHTENFISKFCRYYTPIVVGLAAFVAFVPPIFIDGAVFSDWFYRGLIFLVVSCPCALVLSIPLSFFGGIGTASRNGILIKGSNYLEALRYADTVVMDKTGTITKGVFKVTNIKSISVSDNELLRYAYIAEKHSNHPIGRSIAEAYRICDDNYNVEDDKIQSFEESAAYGIKTVYDGMEILAGNKKLMERENINFENSADLGTVVYVAVDGKYCGHIIISDEIKDDSVQAIKDMKAAGVKNVVMLTGDNKVAADSIAKEAGIDTVYSDLLPDQKVEILEGIADKNEKGKTVFIGDGINDAPVLARADIGIAMGGVGSDAAIEASDIVFMTDELSKFAHAKKIADKTNKIVWQNIIFAMAIKIIVMAMSAGGVANMWEAIFADVGVSIIAVLNAMRMLRE